MNRDALSHWQQLTITDRQDIYNEVAAHINLSSTAVEKDWWVVRTLKLVLYGNNWQTLIAVNSW
jgi:hypothetical protein